MKIAFGNDHAGYAMKKKLVAFIEAMGHEVSDLGTHNEESTDYPDYAHPLALMVEEKKADLGIALCGSGNGISITLNKHQKIRAALCWNAELASLARQHNDANILSLPARFVSLDDAKEICEAFLTSSFEGGRHARRVDKIACK